jgi:hypothetical protein
MFRLLQSITGQLHEQRLLLSALTAANQSIESLESSQQLLACDAQKQRQQFVRYAGVRVQPTLMEHWALHGLQSVRITAHSNRSTIDQSSVIVWNVQHCIHACASDPHCHSFVLHPLDSSCYLLPLSTGLLLRSHLLDQNTVHKGDSHYFEKLCLSKGTLLDRALMKTNKLYQTKFQLKLLILIQIDWLVIMDGRSTCIPPLY